jgi:anti-sigma factor RsiW
VPSKYEGFFRILSYIRGMMSSADQQRFDDQVLIRYLLGSLPEEEAGQLDELSIADDAFAWRLSAVENDLVDSYVRGDLSGDNLAQFKGSYLSTPKRLQKLELAQALSSFNPSTAAAAAQAAPALTAPRSRQAGESSTGLSFSRWLSVPRLALQWGFAAGALGLLFVSGYLLLDNARLGRLVSEAPGSRAAFERHEQELQRQLNEQSTANAEMVKELERLRASQPNLDQLKTLSALLLPPTRGTGSIPTVSVPRGTDLVVLLLTLETDDFPTYRVGLKDLATRKTVWHSANLGSTSKTVSFSFRAELLKQQNYALELSGVAPNGHVELISGYPIRVVIK